MNPSPSALMGTLSVDANALVNELVLRYGYGHALKVCEEAASFLREVVARAK